MIGYKENKEVPGLNACVPETDSGGIGLHEELASLIDEMDAAEKILAGRKKKVSPVRAVIVPLLTVSVAASLLLFLSPFSDKSGLGELEDTYNDPVAAYAEIKSTLDFISEKMDSGKSGAEKARNRIEECKDYYNMIGK